MPDDKYINVRTTISTTITDIDILVEYIPLNTWILVTGYWDDENIWIDTENWID